MKSLSHRDFIEASYSKEWAFTSAERIRARILARLSEGSRDILDLGCYNGRIAQFLKPAASSLIGTDLSFEALKSAQRKGVVCIQADASLAIPFKTGVFDCVVAAELIEHIFDLDTFMDEIKRVLKKGGSLVISTPNLASLGRRFYLLAGKNPLIEIESARDSVGHIRYFVKETLFRLLRKHGFRIRFFSSDVVNFDNSGERFSRILARLLPGFGKSLIVKAINE
ncbi:MAG: class I SAM-dependent methyltransferase [Candidatus Omnitrophica bacterium]|nr:class I SAM-dependent methyltransferase [Candidatus Omnitrophota bacterium]